MSETRSCEHCGAVVSADAKFCRECGKTISGERACPHCGAALSPTAQFCRECGKPVALVPSQPPATRVAAPPAQVPRAAKQPATPTPRRSGSKGGVLIVGGCVALVMLCLIGAVGVFFAIRSGTISQKTLLNLTGLGPGTITVMNFRDDAIQTTVAPIKPSQNSEPVGRIYNLDAYGITTLQTIDAGKYRVDIQIRKTGEMQGSCALNVRGGDAYRFVSLPNGILLVRENSPSSDPNDLFPETSAFCR